MQGNGYASSRNSKPAAKRDGPSEQNISTCASEFPGAVRSRFLIPPTAVGGWFQSSLQTGTPTRLNPTNGSWWMVQVWLHQEGQVGLERSTDSRR
jgi:hypothetical protein